MSAPTGGIQSAVIDLLKAQGPVRAADIGQWLKSYDRAMLDTCLAAMTRAKRIRLTLGFYELPESERPSRQKQPNDEPPPTAAEEVAASLAPATQICTDCEGDPQPMDNFQIGRGDRHLKICRTCMGKRAIAGRGKGAHGRAPTHPPEQSDKPQEPPSIPTTQGGGLPGDRVVIALQARAERLQRELNDTLALMEQLRTLVPEAFK